MAGSKLLEPVSATRLLLRLKTARLARVVLALVPHSASARWLRAYGDRFYPQVEGFACPAMGAACRADFSPWWSRFRPYNHHVRLTYRYRLYPTSSQESKIEEWLESLRQLYNFALTERRDTYKVQGRSISVYEQKRALPMLKKRSKRYASIHSQVLQDVLFRLDKAFGRYFAGGGYPRFKACGIGTDPSRYSQEEFSFRVGLHQTYVSSVERGERDVTIQTADRIAKALGTTLADLFGELERESNEPGN